jgi:hypothetical protein
MFTVEPTAILQGWLWFGARGSKGITEHLYGLERPWLVREKTGSTDAAGTSGNQQRQNMIGQQFKVGLRRNVTLWALGLCEYWADAELRFEKRNTHCAVFEIEVFVEVEGLGTLWTDKRLGIFLLNLEVVENSKAVNATDTP